MNEWFSVRASLHRGHQNARAYQKEGDNPLLMIWHQPIRRAHGGGMEIGWIRLLATKANYTAPIERLVLVLGTRWQRGQ